ncbi:MAG: DUF3102 domain-containing protein, partial [Clostridia bacterium]|nr:DUF3102 domain-containing protein [Clostridia bacterium]
MSELDNQITLSDFLPAAPAADPGGYDAAGHLINPTEGTGNPVGTPCMASESPDPVGALPSAPAVIPSPVGAMSPSPEALPTDASARLSEIAAEVNTLTEHARGAVIAAALAIGRRLIEAKSLVPRGRFGEWLSANVSYSERKAQDMMRLYEEYGRDTLPESIQRLDYTKAVALLQLPEDERAPLAERAAEEGLSSRQLQAEIDRLNQQHQQDQLKIYDLIQQGEASEQAIQLERDAAQRARGDADAARTTADKLRKDLKRIKTDASGAIARATAAEADKKDAEAQLQQARAELEKLKSAAPETVEVTRIPPEVADELN